MACWLVFSPNLVVASCLAWTGLPVFLAHAEKHLGLADAFADGSIWHFVPCCRLRGADCTGNDHCYRVPPSAAFLFPGELDGLSVWWRQSGIEAGCRECGVDFALTAGTVAGFQW